MKPRAREAAVLDAIRGAVREAGGLNAKANLSGDMALRFEKAFGVDMDTLMRRQNSYDIARTRNRAKSIRVERYGPDSAA